MSSPIISVENLSKAYRIGLKEQVHDTLVGATKSWLRAPLRNWKNLRGLDTSKADKDSDDILWALKDVNFEVHEGEVVGVIGRNGAGKSTLLKVLSRITEPTSGWVKLRGRVSSLLEVGTGFHPELSRRDNIYMNGTILGMMKKEIDRKFDEIVEFSGVEKFLDTPVKRYSSGMQVRLAFAVAAHLEPEILIVDEVLAVGDAEFQKKCLGKMQDVSQSGRTVLFVSHNMPAVQGLCTSAVMLQGGECVMMGATDDVIASYLQNRNEETANYTTGAKMSLIDRINSYRPGKNYIRSIEIRNVPSKPDGVYETSQPFEVRIELSGLGDHRSAQVGFIIKRDDDRWITMVNTGMCPPIECQVGDNQLAVFSVPKMPLVPGTYWIDLSVAIRPEGRIDYVDRAARIEVIPYDVYGSGYSLTSNDGVCYLDGEWRLLTSNASTT